MTNWQAIQVPRDKKNQNRPLVPGGVNPKYMSMGSFHADASKDGKSRKQYKITGAATVK